MHPLIERLLATPPVLTDGAWGTRFQEEGLAPGDYPDAWNLDYPERVERLARSYVEAGSRLILTNTFRANRITLERPGLSGRVEEINRAGVAISRRAAQGRAHVFASMGPSGKLLLSGEVTEEQLRSAFREQAQALAAAGAEGIVIETMSDLAEAVLATRAARETGLAVVACMTFDSGKQRDRTMMGVTPEQAAEELTRAGADVIGANCGQGIDAYEPLCMRLHAATGRPLWIKPNAGLPVFEGGRFLYKMTAEEFARGAPSLVQAGAAFLGGCCGTSPGFVRALSQALVASWQTPQPS